MNFTKFKFLAVVVVILLPTFVFAAGLVPCNGVDCTFCDFFLLLQNIFNFLMNDLVPIVAVAMVVWGGYTFMISGGNQAGVKKGRDILKNTFIGLLIIYACFVAASYVIGFFAKTNGAIDYGFHGNTFSFSCQSVSPAIDISKYYKGGVISITIQDTENGSQAADLPNTAFGQIGNIAIVGNTDVVDVNTQVQQGLQGASQDQSLLANDIGLSVVSGKRTLDQQKIEVGKNCPDGATSSSQCRIETCIPRDTNGDGVVDGNNCPHVAGVAVDVHGVNLDPATGKPLGQCPNDSACQQKVIDAMRAQGFCKLASEAWHFEKPKVSSSCN